MNYVKFTKLKKHIEVQHTEPKISTNKDKIVINLTLVITLSIPFIMILLLASNIGFGIYYLTSIGEFDAA